ncbi:biotin--[acetyl-CoA-carboxylase] ligase [Fusobacterium sp. MFO224]|uniref:biotin--[acetyl-CoA-carboxylase] ligase n=1 Tax=Fusobacterium sp. MFO224 TaxID=3378070 RepID=UPI00385330F6
MNIYRFREIDSTNTFLKNVREKKDYDVAIAEKQTLGRGRRGNKWSSEKGGAYFSFLLKEKEEISSEEYAKLPLVVGYSLLRTFEKIENLDFKFKWTNDIYINNKKLSGILVEKRENFYIIGIGINLNNEIDEEFKEKGISLRTLNKKYYDREEVILKVINDFKENFKYYLDGNWGQILNYLNSKNYLFGKKILIDLRNSKEEGIGQEIDKTGEFLVEIKGEKRSFSIGEIHIKRS